MVGRPGRHPGEAPSGKAIIVAPPLVFIKPVTVIVRIERGSTGGALPPCLAGDLRVLRGGAPANVQVG